MNFEEEEEYVEPTILSKFSGIAGFVVGIVIVLLSSLFSSFYFAHTNIPMITSEAKQSIIAIAITVIEVYIISYFRNRKKDLAKFSKSEFDSTHGCWILIALLVSGVFLNGILFREINGRFDFRSTTKRKTKIINKTRRGNTRGPTLIYRHYFIIQNWKDEGREFDLQIPGSVFDKFNSGDMVEFETKPGLLGFEHVAGKITRAE